VVCLDVINILSVIATLRDGDLILPVKYTWLHDNAIECIQI